MKAPKTNSDIPEGPNGNFMTIWSVDDFTSNVKDHYNDYYKRLNNDNLAEVYSDYNNRNNINGVNKVMHIELAMALEYNNGVLSSNEYRSDDDMMDEMSSYYSSDDSYSDGSDFDSFDDDDNGNEEDAQILQQLGLNMDDDADDMIDSSEAGDGVTVDHEGLDMVEVELSDNSESNGLVTRYALANGLEGDETASDVMVVSGSSSDEESVDVIV